MAEQQSPLSLALQKYDSPQIIEEPFNFEVTNRCRMDAKLQVHSNYISGHLIQTFPQMDSVHSVDFADSLKETFQELQPQLSNKDANIRRQGIHKLTQVIQTMVHSGYDKDNHTQSTDIFGNEPRQIFNQALAYLLRLKIRCPFSDVRDESKRILHDLDVSFMH